MADAGYGAGALALISAANPMRLDIALLLIPRPRPMRNLLAHWLGGMATGITAALGLLTLLRDVAPMIFQHVAAAAASSTARHIQMQEIGFSHEFCLWVRSYFLGLVW